MKSLPTLIKLCQRNIEDVRKRLIDREEKKSQLQLFMAELERQIHEERQLVAREPAMAMTFDAFFRMYRQHKSNAMAALMDVERQIIHLREDMAELYTDKKKFELLLERQQERLKKQQKALENNSMDEMALRPFTLPQE